MKRRKPIALLIEKSANFFKNNPNFNTFELKSCEIGINLRFKMSKARDIDKDLSTQYNFIERVGTKTKYLVVHRTDEFQEFNKQYQEKLAKKQLKQKLIEEDKQLMSDYENANFKGTWTLYNKSRSLPITPQLILKKMKHYSPIVLVLGETQSGKSTFAWLLANWLSLNIHGKYWNWKRFCAKSVKEFMNLVDKYDNQIIIIEETSFQLGSRDWQKITDKVFGKLLDTQAYKHNCYILTMPYALGGSTTVRRSATYFFAMIKKGLIGGNVVKHRYSSLTEMKLYSSYIDIINYGKFMERNKLFKLSNQYTDFVKEFKKDIMQKLKKELEKHEKKEAKKEED